LSVNKNKIIVQAQKLTAAGKFDKAILEYEKLVREDPADIRTWLKMGDLYTRMGSRGDATATYIKVAEQYQKAGFHLKAVAVYKQILKIDPTLVDVYEMLADAYLHLGLTSEALIQLEQLADIHQRTGQTGRMVEALTRMAELNPGNIATRLRIAEQHSKDGNAAAAVVQFRLACDQLREQGRMDDFAKVAERLLFHDPNAVDVAREAAVHYLENRQYKRALAKLQVCFSRDHRDVRTLELLAEAFDGLGQPEKSVSVYNEIAHVIGDGGDQQKRRQIYERILAIDPQNQAALTALGKGQSAPTRVARPAPDGLPSPAGAPAAAAEPQPAAGPLVTVENFEELSDEEIASRAQKILGETDVLLKYGLADRALDHLAKIFEFDFFNLDGRERMRDILLKAGREDEAVEQLFVLVEGFVEDQPEGAVYYLHQILDIDGTNAKAIGILKRVGGVLPAHILEHETDEEIGGFEAVGESPSASVELTAPDPVEPAFDIGGDDLLGGFEDEDEDDTAQIDLLGLEGEEPEAGVLVEDAEEEPEADEEEVFDLDESLAVDPAPPPPPARDEVSGLDWGLDLDEMDLGEEEDEVELVPEPEPPEPAAPARAAALPRPAKEPESPALPRPAKEPESPALPRPAKEPESPALPRPAKEPESPALPRPAKEPESPALPRPSAPAPARQPIAPRRVAPEPRVEAPAAPAPPAATAGPGDLPDISAEIEEIDFFISQELFDEAKGVLEELLAEHPDDPRLARFVEELLAPPPAPEPASEPAAPPPATEADDEILVEDDSGDDDDVLDFDQLAEDLDQLVDDLATEETTTDQQVSDFEEVFSKFKAGVQEQVASTDFATHYDLGMAYKEMGLYDDAISEFEIARGDPRRGAQVAIMIGICHLGGGRTDQALAVLEGGLELAGLTADETLALKYELAKAHETRGEKDRALDLYNEVLIEDPGFADVVERIDALGG
jgi:tetratricopeptide (TPR) repeat protein